MGVRSNKFEDSTMNLSGSISSFKSRPKKRRIPLYGIFLLQLALILILGCQPCPSQPYDTSFVKRGVSPFPVYLTIHVMNVGHLDIQTGSFIADFYLELSSDRPYSLDSIEFMNGFPSIVEALETTPTNKSYRIQAALSTDIDLRAYPFDHQVLPVVIEDRLNTSDKTVFIFDQKNSSIEPGLTMVGWLINGIKGETQSHTYLINNSTYSRFVFDIYIGRAQTTSMVMFFLPAALIVFVSLLTMLLKGERLSNRITLSGTMLLAAILLHLRVAGGLPNISYLTLADRFMISNYVVLSLVTMSAILLGFCEQRADRWHADLIYRYSLLAIPILSLSVYLIFLIIL